MRPLRLTEEQIIGALREQEAGGRTADVCRKHGVSPATFYKWKARRHTPGIRLRKSLIELTDSSRLRGDREHQLP